MMLIDNLLELPSSNLLELAAEYSQPDSIGKAVRSTADVSRLAAVRPPTTNTLCHAV
eukprot:SAG31_NODE_125_length_23649_cov_7.156202_14_plen_57_part_00